MFKKPFFEPAGAHYGGFSNASGISIHRKCQQCNEEDKKAQRKEEGKAEGPGITNEHETYNNSLDGSGKLLSQGERNFFEPRFGYDFSNVRVHTGSEASISAKSINARAYTSGNNIVFSAGEYQPGSEGGKKLLAHELTHVVQQTGQVQRAPDATATVPPTKQSIIDKANSERLSNLLKAWNAVLALHLSLRDTTYDRKKLPTDHTKAIAALSTWIKINPSDSDYQVNVDKVMLLVYQNLSLYTKPPAFYQTATGPADSKGKVLCATPAFAWSYTSDPNAGVSCCDLFFKANDLCRADVLTHEHFHLVGLGHGTRGGKDTTRAERTVAECLNSADNMAQLVGQLAGKTNDNC
ncbi:MAG TPA: DUF4157 domain-containing protein [Chitinophagaceae bacterium]|nr:DUF4157 domain-containing protein [Chitinophagaceae bacterium]